MFANICLYSFDDWPGDQNCLHSFIYSAGYTDYLNGDHSVFDALLEQKKRLQNVSSESTNTY